MDGRLPRTIPFGYKTGSPGAWSKVVQAFAKVKLTKRNNTLRIISPDKHKRPDDEQTVLCGCFTYENVLHLNI